MPEVKPNATIDVAIATTSASDLEWARSGLPFRLGESSWPERIRAVIEHHGGLDRMVEATGLKLGRIRSWQTRGSKPRDLLDVAAQLGLSPEYLDDGRPTIDADFAIEHARLVLAQKKFTATGSSQLRRSARNQVVEEWRAAIENARTASGPSQLPAVAAGLDEAEDAPYAPGMLEVRLDQPGISQAQRAPVAFSRDWLVRQRLDPDHLAGLDLGRRGFYLVDTSPAGQQLVDGCLYALLVGSAFSVWRCRRGEGGLLELQLPDAASGPAARPNAHLVAGRLVYELAPI